MSLSVSRPQSSPKPSFTANEHLDTLQAKLKSEPSNLLDVGFELLELFPVPPGQYVESNYKISAKEDDEAPHAVFLAKSLHAQIATKMGDDKTFKDAFRSLSELKTLKNGGNTISLDRDQEPKVRKFVKAFFAKDKVSLKFSPQFLKKLVGYLSTPFAPFAFLALLAVSPFAFLYFLVCGPVMLRDRIARRDTYRTLAVHQLLLKVDKKLKGEQVKNPDLLKLIDKIVEDYKSLSTFRSKASQNLLDGLAEKNEIQELCRKYPTRYHYGSRQPLFIRSPKVAFYDLISDYLLKEREGQPVGSAPKNAGKALYRVLCKHLDEFVKEEDTKSSE